MELTATQISLSALAAFMVGFNKTGLPGLSVLLVPIMAIAFPSRQSVGMVLPMLVFADFFAVWRYRKHAEWGVILRLLPSVVVGLLAGWLALHYLTDRTTKPLLGFMVLGLIVLQLVVERWKSALAEELARHWMWTAFMGALAGFATMVANLAGAIMTLYLLGMKLDKHKFMGTSAWYFFMVNWSKVPVQAMEGMITGATLMFNLACAPVVALGAFAGMKSFDLMTVKLFSRLAMIMAGASAVYLLADFFFR